MSNQRYSIVSYRASQEDLPSARDAIAVRTRRLEAAAAREAQGVRLSQSDLLDLIELADLERVESRLAH